MKKTCAVIWALALFAFMLPVNAGAADPSHFSLAIGITCNTCHQANRTLGETKGTPGVPILRSSPAVYNNICQSCHRSGDGFAKNKPMALVDTSAIFGDHSTANFGNLRQTSHRWDGSDTNPGAGAQTPIQGAMTTNTNLTGDLRGRTGNQLACVRCHSPHLTDAPGAMLRMPIDQGQMCVDCHRSRNQQSHTSGTHPVGVNYDAAVAKGNFNANPLNANPINPTSDMGNYLTTTAPTRNIICTTCHGVHYTDSRSSTFDGASTAKGKGNYTNLSTGDGYQLRTDRRGAKVNFTVPTQDKLNICTNCHSNKSNHNAGGQDVQCNDCHGAHVEYDPNDPTNTKGTNVYLIRRNVKKGGMPSSIYFRYTGNNREYRNAAGTGVCQGCHNVPESGGKYPPEHDSGKASDCNKCHFHSSPMGSFSGACGQCHNTSGGLATSDITNATGGLPGAHAAHVTTGLKMECNTCHDGYAGRAMPSYTIDIGFSINGTNVPGFTNVLNTGTYNNTQTLSAAYTGTGKGFVGSVGSGPNQTCSAIYCHGSTLTGGVSPAPSWTGGPSQATCGTCHGVTAAAPHTLGSHSRHAGAAAGQLQIPCASCHGLHTDNKHVNGDVKWNMTGINGQYKTPTGRFYTISGSTGRLAPSTAYGTCSTVYCHSNGGANGAAIVYNTVTWGGAALNCGSCHANMATTGAANGGHYKHASTGNVGGPAFDCSICHSGYTTTATNGATHANKFVDLINAVTGYSKASPMTAGATWGTCSTSQCHGQATGLSWNNGSIWQTGGDRCSTCHSSTTGVSTGTPFYSTSFPAKQTLNTNAKVGAHTIHVTSTNIMNTSLNCADCHGTVGLKDATHMNGTTNFVWSALATKSGALTPSYDPATGTCSNVYCHGARMPYLDTTGTNRSPSWKTPFMPATLTPESCKSCHGFPPSPASNHPVVATPTSFPTPLCTPCHPNMSATGSTYANIFVDKSLHIDGKTDTNGGSCDSCHGYPPARPSFAGYSNASGRFYNFARQQNYTGAGGSHTLSGHISPKIDKKDGWVNCTNCHNENDHQQYLPAKVSLDSRVRFNSAIQPKYSSNKLAGAQHLAGKCSNVACHFQKTPRW